jgi:hypothetical protein
MTYHKLADLILEGAPSKREQEIAALAMQHSSYTSFAFRIIHSFKTRGLSAVQEEDLVVMFSLNFYTHDLPRFSRTGTFNKNT